MRIFKRYLVILATIFVLLGAFYIFWLSPRYTVPILMYHRFGYEKQTLFVTPENFERQMRYLKKHKYSVITLDELAEGIKARRGFKHNTVVITVDDGYEDNYKYAYPVLKKYNFPVTIFVVANFIGNNQDFFNWDEARQMLNNGITLGGHTKNNVYVPSITSDDILRDEIAGAKKVIEDNTQAPVYYFCYPTGGFTEKAKQVVKEAGYKAACTTNRGFVDFNKDLYELKRVKVTNSDTNKPFSFWAKLTGYYNLFRTRKSGS
jgi:peptidoglycan/xylan/chitin deacetylase (PgdA/CDA1 family)